MGRSRRIKTSQVEARVELNFPEFRYVGFWQTFRALLTALFEEEWQVKYFVKNRGN